MRAAGVRRISVISAAGVGDSRAVANAAIRFLIATSNVGYAYADLEHVEAMLKTSDLDWQAVRPTTLSNRRGTIPREDVAVFMLRELEAARFSVR